MSTQAGTDPPRGPRRLLVILCLLLVLALTFVAYTPTLQNSFTNWDDHKYVTHNESIRLLDWAHLKGHFATYCMGNYHPLTMVSIALNYRIGGLAPRPYYLTQVLLHLVNTVLVFFLARLLLRNAGLALVTAALFGVHTLHVESVAWASARKDLLYALFFFGALISWVRYRDSGRMAYYVTSMLLFVAALLSKGMAVALLPTLWAVDHFYARRSWNRVALVETAPFLVLAVVFGVVAVLAQRAAAAVSEDTYSLHRRLAFAAYGLVQYACKLVVPLRLSAIYPYPSEGPGVLPLRFWAYPPLALALLALGLRVARRQRLVGFGIAFTLVNVALVLQLIPVGDAIMADRYMYVASFGAFVAVAAASTMFLRGRRGGRVKVGVAAIYVVVLAGLTYARCQSWRDSLTLWNDVLAKHPHAVPALNNRGDVLYARGELHAAIADYSEALRLRPADSRYRYNRGAARLQAGDLRGAREDFDDVIRSGTLMLYEAYCGRGTVHRRLGDLPRAIADYTAAVNLWRTNPVAWLNRGLARYLQRDLQGCIGDLDEVLQLQPNEVQALVARGKARIDLGRRADGCADLRRADRLGAAVARQMLREHCEDHAMPGS